MSGTGAQRGTQNSIGEPSGGPGGSSQASTRPILSHTCTRSATSARETLRRIKHGPIKPMVEPSFWERLFGLG